MKDSGRSEKTLTQVAPSYPRHSLNSTKCSAAARGRPPKHRMSNIVRQTKHRAVSRLNQSRRGRQLGSGVVKSVPVSSEPSVRRGRGRPSSVKTGTSAGRGKTRKFRERAVGVRRSPRSHAQTSVSYNDDDDAQSDEDMDTEAVVEPEITGEDNEQIGNDSLNLSASSPAVAEELEQPAVSDNDDDDADVSEHSDRDENAEENYEIVNEDIDEVVDVVDNDNYDNEDDSTTRSLSPFEPQPSPKVTRDISHWLGDDPEAMRNSLLFDADAANSMSSEADSVDVVSSMVVDDRHAAELAREMTPTLVPTPAESSATPLQDLEEFTDRRMHATEVGEDSSEPVDKSTSQLGAVLSQSWPQLNEPPSLPTTSPTTTHSTSHQTSQQITDVRRGAMWRDSLFPSDFPAESTTTSVPDSAAGKSIGKPAVMVEKPGMERPDKPSSLRPQRTLSVDWDGSQQQADILSAHANQSSSTPACRGNFPPATPPVSNLQYQYGNIIDKPPADLQGSGFRYASGRRSVGLGNDSYSRGLIYDTPSGSAQHQRAASVRPTLSVGPSADAQRLSHMWPGAPLPAHQHHVSLSHLQHLVNDDLQYAAPPPLSAASSNPIMPPGAGHMTSAGGQNAGEFVRPCAGGSQQRGQHGSRQQHKAHHHKPTVTANQPAHHSPAASLTAAAAAGYDMFSACRIQQPIGYFPHQGAAAALPMGVVGLHHAQMVAAAANFGQPMPAGQAANSAMYSAAAAAAYSYLNGGGLQPFNVDINSVMRR